jgi:hypothetical protein
MAYSITAYNQYDSIEYRAYVITLYNQRDSIQYMAYSITAYNQFDSIEYRAYVISSYNQSDNVKYVYKQYASTKYRAYAMTSYTQYASIEYRTYSISFYNQYNSTKYRAYTLYCSFQLRYQLMYGYIESRNLAENCSQNKTNSAVKILMAVIEISFQNKAKNRPPYILCVQRKHFHYPRTKSSNFFCLLIHAKR